MKLRFKGKAKLFLRNLKRRDPKQYKKLKSFIKKQRRILEDEFEKDLKKERRRLRRQLREDLRDQTETLEERMEQEIRDALRNELYSEEYLDVLRSVLRGEEDGSGFGEIAEEFLNEDAEVITAAGSIAGTVTEVGENYLVLRETDSTIVIVPFENVTSIRPQS